ncbi:MAG: hypothetical protein U5M23_16425 [Marinagarivorans sp.]|nr:hypothetical protein [Marinagarivorans sp.]
MVKALFVALVVILLSGCYDRFYGPSIQNGFDQEILIEIEYENANKQESYWPPCHTAFIGKKDAEVKRVIVRKNGVVLHDLDRAALADYLKKEKQHKGYSVWRIDSEGISFSVDQKECSEQSGTGPNQWGQVH